MRRRTVAGGLLLLGALAASRIPAVSAEVQAAKPADYSNDAFVIESRSTKTTFENDGTSSTTADTRIRIQSQAGVQAFGLLKFPYASATSTMEVVYARVIKPDKRVVETPAENVLDMPADITRQAPFYSDLKELQVAVKGLEAGDTLEVESREQVKKPLDPGQFWGTFQFFTNGIVLQETIEIRVPRDRAVRVKSATVQPAISEDGAYRVYRWKTENLAYSPAKDADSTESQPPDVQVTSFQNWDEVGQWVRSLFAPRAAPTPQIQAKAAELTRSATTETDKIQAIYAFVSTKFRYIGIALGIGRYQPHAAADILSNDYGDCKDKHILLASLLSAAGASAYPALINSQAKIDPDVPSPGQFDHVITAIPQGKGYLFLDATPEVGPFGYLTANLRDKKALVVPNSGPAELAQTPADPPFPSYFNFQADGTLDGSGTLESKMQMTFRGDSELLYRLTMRQAGVREWKDVMQRISQNLGFGGTVSDVTATPPDATDTPFHIGYSYQREKYGDWENRRIGPPFPPVFVPLAPDDKDKKPKPVELGSPGVSDYKATIQLPANSTPQLPPAVHLSEDFAEYAATYSYSGGVLHAERRLITKMREVAPGQLEVYRRFLKAITDDVNTLVSLSPGAAPVADVSGSAEARELYEQGQEAWQLHNMPAATEAFRRAVDKDPKFAQAWIGLGMLHAATGARDQGIEEMKRAIALEPGQTLPYEVLGTFLMAQHRPEEALASWRDLEKTAPQNPDAPRYIGAILVDLKRYSEAVPELETAMRLDPRNTALLVPLSTAYARSGDREKAIATLEKSAQADSSANNLNSVAHALADDDLQLNDALKYAEQAVKDEESETARIDLDHLTDSSLRTPSSLAAYWDTLGWVHFHMGHVDAAEKYIDAGWRVAQDPVIGDHLGQVYEKEGKKQQAITAYSDTLATRHAPEGTTVRLEALHRGTSAEWGKASDPIRLQDMRMVKVKVSPKPAQHASAEFFVLLAPGPKVVAVKFLNEHEEFPGAAAALKMAKFEVPFPDEGPVQILRRGFLDCEPVIPDCTAALIPLADVRSVN